MNVGDYVEYWYNTYRITRHAPSTAALARNYIRVHIQPSELGQMEITKARTVHYQIFLRDLLLHGNKCKLPSLGTYGQPLSSWTVTKIRQILIPPDAGPCVKESSRATTQKKRSQFQ